MELWIRSQDKKLFEKAYMIKAGIVDNQPVIVVNNDYVYGNYKTIERAIEVLDQIHKRILNLNTELTLNNVYKMPME